MQPATAIPEIPVLSPSEFRIFAVLARQGPITIRNVGQILARRDPDFTQGYTSIGTLLQRMIKKGYVQQENYQDKGAKLYRALLPYDLVLRRQIDYFLDTYLLTAPQELRSVVEAALDRLAPEAQG